MRLDLLDFEKVQAFDRFIESFPHASFMQSRAWQTVKKNWEAAYFYVERDGQIRGTLSLIYIYDAKTQGIFAYVPAGPVCAKDDLETMKALIDEARAFAREIGAFLLRIEPNIPYSEDLAQRYSEQIAPLLHDKNYFSQAPMSMILAFKGRDIETLFTEYSKNARHGIRSAYKKGLCLYVGTREDLPIFHQFMREMSERKGIGYRDLDYFERLFDAFGDRLTMSFAALPEDENKQMETNVSDPIQGCPVYRNREGLRLIACSLLLRFGQVATSIYGADPLYENLGQSYFLDFEEIRYALMNGLDAYDMGGVYEANTENGLYCFKNKMTQGGLIRWIGVWDFVEDESLYQRFQKHEQG